MIKETHIFTSSQKTNIFLKFGEKFQTDFLKCFSFLFCLLMFVVVFKFLQALGFLSTYELLKISNSRSRGAISSFMAHYAIKISFLWKSLEAENITKTEICTFLWICQNYRDKLEKSAGISNYGKNCVDLSHSYIFFWKIVFLSQSRTIFTITTQSLNLIFF